jgi:hypothetical protein
MSSNEPSWPFCGKDCAIESQRDDEEDSFNHWHERD